MASNKEATKREIRRLRNALHYLDTHPDDLPPFLWAAQRGALQNMIGELEEELRGTR